MGDQTEILTGIYDQLKGIRSALEKLATCSPPAESNFERPLADFPDFDWGSIDAKVMQRDSYGVSLVEHGGSLYRRMNNAKFGNDIWFSRSSGKKDENGDTIYVRLIRFREIKDAEPLPEKIQKAVASAPKRAPAPAISPKAPELGDPPAASDDPVEYFNNRAPVPVPNPQPEKHLNGAGPVSASQYYPEATGKTHGLTTAEAREVAFLMGVNINEKSPDFTAAFRVLPYFAEARAGGMDFVTARAILSGNRYELERALPALRKELPK